MKAFNIKWNLSLVAAIVSVIVVGAMTSFSIAADQKWAVILSPGPEDGVPWGGYHVTITGYSDSHTCRWDWGETWVCGDLGKILSHYYHDDDLFNGEGWHLHDPPHGHLPYLRQWDVERSEGKTERVWVQTFDSDTLDTLAGELEHEGFDKIKGPEHTRKIDPNTGKVKVTPWHISLTGNKKNSQNLVDDWKNFKVDWYLWLVPEPSDNCIDHGKGCPTWTRIK